MFSLPPFQILAPGENEGNLFLTDENFEFRTTVPGKSCYLYPPVSPTGVKRPTFCPQVSQNVKRPREK